MRTSKQLRIGLICLTLLFVHSVKAQYPTDSSLSPRKLDTIPVVGTDTIPNTDTIRRGLPGLEIPVLPPVEPLRIVNLNPYLTLNVDSTFEYDLDINKDEKEYHWFITRSAVSGVKIDSKTGKIHVKPIKSYFLSGRLKYDHEYDVMIGVQSLKDPSQRVDTTISLLFYNTEIIPSRLKLSTTAVVTLNEGQTLNVQVQCENGTFPFESVTYYTSIPLIDAQGINGCDQTFNWTPNYSFVKDTDSAKVKIFQIYFVGTTKMMMKDTAMVRVIVKDALDYPSAVNEHKKITAVVNRYILQLKYTFFQLDRNVKKTRNTRTTFDITSSATSLSGSILSSSSSQSSKDVGKVMPGVGVTLVPVKEAVAPTKNTEQNQATLIRSSIKRLELMLQDNALIGDRDEQVVQKTTKLKDELKQMQLQLIDVPIEIASSMSEKELNDYFNSPKVNRKYRTKR